MEKRSTVAIDGVILKFTLVGAAIFPGELALAVFYTVVIVTFVFAAIWPYFGAFTLLFVVKPHPGIRAASEIFERPKTMGLVLFPVSLVNITVRVDKPPMAAGGIVFSISFVTGSILPNLRSEPMALFSLPLTEIEGAGLKFCGFT